MPSTVASGTNFPAYMECPPPTADMGTESLAIPPFSIPRAISPPNTGHTTRKVEQSRTNLSSENSPPPVSRVTDKWADQAIIGVRPAPSKTLIESRSDLAKSNPNGLLGRRALPGLTTSTPSLPSEIFNQEDKQGRSPSTPPGRHTRIPSTGNRATIMDVAQAWSKQSVRPPSTTVDAEVADDTMQNESPEMIESLAEAIPRPRQMTPPNVQAEKRKSSYEKYSAIILPSLPEEKTPAQSPAGTLSRSGVQDQPEQRGADKYGLRNKPIPSPARTLEVAASIDTNLVHFGEPHWPCGLFNSADRIMCRSRRRTSSTNRYRRHSECRCSQIYAQSV